MSNLVCKIHPEYLHPARSRNWKQCSSITSIGLNSRTHLSSSQSKEMAFPHGLFSMQVLNSKLTQAPLPTKGEPSSWVCTINWAGERFLALQWYSFPASEKLIAKQLTVKAKSGLGSRCIFLLHCLLPANSSYSRIWASL